MHQSPLVPNKSAVHHLCLSFHVLLIVCGEKEGCLVRKNQSFQFLAGEKWSRRKKAQLYTSCLGDRPPSLNYGQNKYFTILSALLLSVILHHKPYQLGVKQQTRCFSSQTLRCHSLSTPPSPLRIVCFNYTDFKFVHPLLYQIT